MSIYVSWRCWVFLRRGRQGKHTFVGQYEKFEHTLFNFVKISTKLICKIGFSIYIIKPLFYKLFELIQCVFLEFFLPQLIIYSPKPLDHRAMLVVERAKNNIQLLYIQLLYICYIQLLYIALLEIVFSNVTSSTLHP